LLHASSGSVVLRCRVLPCDGRGSSFCSQRQKRGTKAISSISAGAGLVMHFSAADTAHRILAAPCRLSLDVTSGCCTPSPIRANNQCLLKGPDSIDALQEVSSDATMRSVKCRLRRLHQAVGHEARSDDPRLQVEAAARVHRRQRDAVPRAPWPEDGWPHGQLPGQDPQGQGGHTEPLEL